MKANECFEDKAKEEEFVKNTLKRVANCKKCRYYLYEKGVLIRSNDAPTISRCGLLDTDVLHEVKRQPGVKVVNGTVCFDGTFHYDIDEKRQITDSTNCKQRNGK